MKDQVTTVETSREISKEELQKTLEIIASSVVTSQSSYIQSMILLDHMLRLPNAREIFDAELKEQARDLWVKMKSTGLQLNDPPILFEAR